MKNKEKPDYNIIYTKDKISINYDIAIIFLSIGIIIMLGIIFFLD